MVRKALGWLLVAAGILLLAYPFMKQQAYKQEQRELLAAFEQLGTIETVPTEEESPSKTTETSADKRLEGAKGLLSIDKIDMELLVFEGVTENELLKGAGMIEPKKQFAQDNIGLAGHRATADGKLFNRLGELKPGDPIDIHTTKETYQYRITDTFVVHKSDISVLDNKEHPTLTLVTCTPLGSWHPPDRLIVQAELENTVRN